MKNAVKSSIWILSMILLLTACISGKANEGTKEQDHSDADNRGEETKAFDHGIIVGRDEDGQRWLITQYEEQNGEPHIRAIWFTLTEETELKTNSGANLVTMELRVGQQVEAWHTGPVAESYPEQAKAASLIVNIEDESEESRYRITKETAIHNAISSIDEQRVFAVKGVEVDDTQNEWIVQLIDVHDLEQDLTVRIDATSGDILTAPIMENAAFRIFSPEPETEVDTTFTVTGQARVFEAAFHWLLEDGHNILAEGFEMADHGAPEWGDFEFEVSYEKSSNPHLMLILYVSSAKDGSTEHKLVLPLKSSNVVYQKNE